MRVLLLLLLASLIALPAAAQSTDTEDSNDPVATPDQSPQPEAMDNGRSAARSSGSTSSSPNASPATPTVNGRASSVRPDPTSSGAAAPVSDAMTLRNGRGEPTTAPAATARVSGAKALSPATVRITNAGPDGDAEYDAFHPDVVYNPVAGEYFVVWAGNDDTGSLASNETEIFGVRVSETTGQPLAAPVRISTMGGDGDDAFAALHPAVTYNPVEDDYLVVWQGSATVGEFEIFGRRLNASDLAAGSQIQLTNAGTAGDASVDLQAPSLAVNSSNGTYFLAWYGNPDGDVEVFGRTLTQSGDIDGSGVLQLSEAGPPGDTAWRAAHPATAYNPATGEFWTVWSGSDDQDGLVAGEHEIFLRRVGESGSLIGTDGQRISATGADGDAEIDAERPAMIADADVGEMFVTWSSNVVDGAGAYEVYGQRLDLTTAAEQGTDDLRLSTMGADGDAEFSGFASSVAGISGREYTVVWLGDDSTDDAFDIYAQRVYADRSIGDEDGEDDLQVSTLSDGGSSYGAVTPRIAAGPTDTYLAVWSGDTSGSGSLVEGEHEIFGQILTLGEPLPVELSTFTAQPLGEDIQLVWQTLSETNNDRFDVQRLEGAAGGKQVGVWRTIGTVRGAGTTTDPVDYQFTDRDLPYAAENLVYRLRQIDTDGAATLSEEIRIGRSAVTRLELLSTFPNPARQRTTVRFAVPESEADSRDARLMLYDVLGRRVRVVEQGIRPGRNEIQLNVDGLAPGMYFLRLAAGQQVRTQKLTVVR